MVAGAPPRVRQAKCTRESCGGHRWQDEAWSPTGRGVPASCSPGVPKEASAGAGGRGRTADLPLQGCPSGPVGSSRRKPVFCREIAESAAVVRLPLLDRFGGFGAGREYKWSTDCHPPRPNVTLAGADDVAQDGDAARCSRLPRYWRLPAGRCSAPGHRCRAAYLVGRGAFCITLRGSIPPLAEKGQDRFSVGRRSRQSSGTISSNSV